MSAMSDSAQQPMAPGELIHIGDGSLSVALAPTAGGRIAQVIHDDVEWLVGHDSGHHAMIAWGCYPMLPWVGRVRDGRFRLAGRDYTLPATLGPHAIHGVGFALPWHVDAHEPRCAELSLELPTDERWPFGGVARQRIEVLSADRLHLRLSVAAGTRAMPVAIGWHPWFRKPDQMTFAPTGMYPRDHRGIPTLPLSSPTEGPWDDCFVNREPVRIRLAGQQLSLTSSCDHWQVYDEPAHATCIEPQSGPPDAFNLEPEILEPGQVRVADFDWEWAR